MNVFLIVVFAVTFSGTPTLYNASKVTDSYHSCINNAQAWAKELEPTHKVTLGFCLQIDNTSHL